MAGWSVPLGQVLMTQSQAQDRTRHKTLHTPWKPAAGRTGHRTKIKDDAYAEREDDSYETENDSHSTE